MSGHSKSLNLSCNGTSTHEHTVYLHVKMSQNIRISHCRSTKSHSTSSQSSLAMRFLSYELEKGLRTITQPIQSNMNLAACPYRPLEELSNIFFVEVKFSKCFILVYVYIVVSSKNPSVMSQKPHSGFTCMNNVYGASHH